MPWRHCRAASLGTLRNPLRSKGAETARFLSGKGLDPDGPRVRRIATRREGRYGRRSTPPLDSWRICVDDQASSPPARTATSTVTALCALALERPCPTFRAAGRVLQPPPQPRLVAAPAHRSRHGPSTRERRVGARQPRGADSVGETPDAFVDLVGRDEAVGEADGCSGTAEIGAEHRAVTPSARSRTSAALVPSGSSSG